MKNNVWECEIKIEIWIICVYQLNYRVVKIIIKLYLDDMVEILIVLFLMFLVFLFLLFFVIFFYFILFFYCCNLIWVFLIVLGGCSVFFIFNWGSVRLLFLIVYCKQGIFRILKKLLNKLVKFLEVFSCRV